MGAIGFRPVHLDDLPLLHHWMQADHVKRWWRGPETLEGVEAKYGPRIRGEAPSHCFFTLHDGRPVGFIQTYLVGDWPDYARQVRVENGTAGIDLFIGDPACLHQGLGPLIIKAFLRDIVFGPSGPFAPGQVRRCVVGPEPANTAAIRAYEKTGFRYWKTIPMEDEPEPEYLMIIRPEDLVL